MKEKTIEKGAGFTQGPWKVGEYEIVHAHPREELPILDETGSYVALADSEFSNNANQVQANARLIAQAPAMYQQCKLFEKVLVHLQMQGETGVDEELENVRELLASVEGGEG